ncbi:MAG TPA: DUF6265 family protein [Thermoanaerobaculia bacterium]|nr:DUF6265 family protein [Thermoanaerobaculia bacterium]
MKRFRSVALVALLALVAIPALAAPPGTLSDFGWLAGRWIDDAGGKLSEETWNAPSGDAMQGMWRYVVDGQARIYEILTISQEDGGLVMRVRHFDPRLVAREEKAAPVVLKLVSSGDRMGVFEGPEPGGPTVIRLTYVSPSDGTLNVTLEKDGKKAGGFSFRRAAK